MRFPSAETTASKALTLPPSRKALTSTRSGDIGAGRKSRTEALSAIRAPCRRASASNRATIRPETAPPCNPPKGPAAGDHNSSSSRKTGSVVAATPCISGLANRLCGPPSSHGRFSCASALAQNAGQPLELVRIALHIDRGDAVAVRFERNGGQGIAVSDADDCRSTVDLRRGPSNRRAKIELGH